MKVGKIRVKRIRDYTLALMVMALAMTLMGCAGTKGGRRADAGRAGTAARTGAASRTARFDASRLGGTPRYRYLYLEATRQKLLGNHSAAFDILRHCVEISPEMPEAIYDLALYYRIMRQDSVALCHLQRAEALDPDNPQYVEALASYYLDANADSMAISWLERLSELKPRRTDVLSRLVNLYATHDKAEDAIDVLNRIEVLEGKMPSVSYRKFQLYKAIDRTGEAYAELEDLCREYPHELSYRLAIGTELLNDNRPDEALRVFEDVRRQDPTNTPLRLSMLQYYRQTGADSTFVAARDSLLFDTSAPSDVRVALLRDFISEEMHDDSLGRTNVDAVFDSLGIATTTDLHLLNLRAAFLATYDSANDSAFAELMDRINTIEPSNTQALFYLIQYHGKRQEFERLEAICRRGVLTHPEELICHYYLGLALYQQDKPAEALQAFQAGIVQQTPDSRPQMVADLYSVMGDVYHEMGRKAEAYAAYDSCLVYQDDNVSCLNNYAYFLSLEDGDLDRAEEMSYRTIRLQPDNKTFLDTYAWILFVKGRYAEAQGYIDRVCPPDSTDSVLLHSEDISGVVLEHAGDIAAQNGNITQAMRFWRLAQEAGGDGLTAVLPRKIRQKKYIR